MVANRKVPHTRASAKPEARPTRRRLAHRHLASSAPQ
jgi:hypothetical protein